MNTTSVTAAPSVPFRRFLPHEKPVPPAPRARTFRTVEVTEEQDFTLHERMPFQLISDEDMSLLMDVRLQDSDWEPQRLLPPPYVMHGFASIFSEAARGY